MTDSKKFAPMEIAYRLPSRKGLAHGEWRRAVISSEAAYDRRLASLEERGAEVRVRPAG
jgi:hypothetical protein